MQQRDDRYFWRRSYRGAGRGGGGGGDDFFDEAYDDAEDDSDSLKPIAADTIVSAAKYAPVTPSW
jgi:hypothetical protein